MERVRKDGKVAQYLLSREELRILQQQGGLDLVGDIVDGLYTGDIVTVVFDTSIDMGKSQVGIFEETASRLL